MAMVVRAFQRSKTHDALLTVMQASGMWARYDIDLQARYVPTSEVDIDALDEEVKADKVDLIFGHHLTPYAGLARPGSPRYVCQASISNGCPDVMCTRADITRVADLRGRRVAVQGTHPFSLAWHMLKQQGIDAEQGEVEFVRVPASTAGYGRLWSLLLAGEVDAAFLSVPFDLQAREAGFRVLEETRFYPNIMGATLTTTATWARAHLETAENLIKAIVHGICLLKTQPEECLDILNRQEALYGDAALNDAKVRYIYDLQVRAVPAKPYPTALAIHNTFEQARYIYRDVPGLDDVNPVAVWDIHLLRQLDDEGFIDALYAARPALIGAR